MAYGQRMPIGTNRLATMASIICATAAARVAKRRGDQDMGGSRDEML
jgi:hypothetical protein